MLQDSATRLADDSFSAPMPDHRRGVEAALARHRPALAAHARRLCRGQLDADDLVQDTFERALRAADRVRDPGAVRGWLFTILTNVFIDRVRMLRSAPEAEAGIIEEMPHVEEPPDDGPWARLTGDDLRAAVARLPADARAVYLAHCIEGMPYASIAAALGIPRGTVGTRLLRARRLLRRLLTERMAEQSA
jgi:RNA polymerase sigma-70 factor (ECF subfamily)